MLPTSLPLTDEELGLASPAAPAVPAGDALARLAGVIRTVESGGKADAVSPQGARGSMQIMPATFKQYAQRGESYDNDEHRTSAALRKLTDDYLHFNGDIEKTAAAYIGGRSAVKADGTIRSDVKDAHGTTPRKYADRVLNLFARSAIAGQPAGDLKPDPDAPPATPKPAAPTWEQVTLKPEFQALSPPDQELMRQKYWDEVVLPRVPLGEEAPYREAFEKDTAVGTLTTVGRSLKHAARQLASGDITAPVVDVIRQGIKFIDDAYKSDPTDTGRKFVDEQFKKGRAYQPPEEQQPRSLIERVQGYKEQFGSEPMAEHLARADIDAGVDYSYTQPAKPERKKPAAAGGIRAGGFADTAGGAAAGFVRPRQGASGTGGSKLTMEIGAGVEGVKNTLDGWRMAELATSLDAKRAGAAKAGLTPEQMRADPDYQSTVEAYRQARERIEQRNEAISKLPRSSAVKKMFEGEGIEGMDNFVEAFRQDPGGATAAIIGGSAPGSLAVVASAVLARLGFRTTGATVAGGGVASYALEFGNEYAGNVEQGMPHNEAWNRAAVKSGVIGLFDAASIGSAGRALDAILKATGVKAVAKRFVKEASKQAVLGAGGETLGAVASGKEPQPGAVLGEAVGEFVMGVPEGVATMGQKRPATTEGARATAARREDTGPISVEDMLGKADEVPASRELAATSPVIESPVIEPKSSASILGAAKGAGDALANVDEVEKTAKTTEGAKATFTTEKGTRLEGNFAVIEAGELVASHGIDLKKNKAFPKELQPRDRERAAYAVHLEGILNNLDPERLGENPLASHGAPIIGEDAVVESGNGRVIVLQKAYAKGGTQADAYRKWVNDNAEKFGIDPPKVQAMTAPVLVRVRKTPVNRAEFARQANADSIAQMSALELAKADASRVGTLDDFTIGDGGEFSAAGNLPFIKRFVSTLPATEQTGMVDAKGRLSQGGYTRVRNAVLARAYGDSDTLMRLVESVDDSSRNLTKALLTAAPKVAKLREDIAAGALHDLDITPDLVIAVEEITRLRDEGKTVRQQLAQNQMFGEKYSPETKALLTFLEANIRSPRRIVQLLDSYLDAVVSLGSPQQGALIERETPAKGEVLEQAQKGVTDEQGPEGASSVPGGEEPAPAVTDGEGPQPGGTGRVIPIGAAARIEPAGARGDGEGTAAAAALDEELEDVLADLGEWADKHLAPKAALIPDEAEQNLLPILQRLFAIVLKRGVQDFKEAAAAVIKEVKKKAAHLADLLDDALLTRAFRQAGGALPEDQSPRRRDNDESLIVNSIARDVSPEEKVAQLQTLTAENVPIVRELMRAVDERFGTRSTDNEKLPERILEKSRRSSIRAQKPWFDVEHVRDSYRFKTVLTNFDALPQIVAEVKGRGFEIVKVDVAKVLAPKEFGFRIAVFDLRAPNGQLIEWYFPVLELEEVKKRGHEIFERWRNEDVNLLSDEQLDRMKADQEFSRKLYDDAFARYLERTGVDESAVRASLEEAAAASPVTGVKSRAKSSPVSGEGNLPRGNQVLPTLSAANRPSPLTNTRPSSATDTRSISTSDDILTQAGRQSPPGRPLSDITVKRKAVEVETGRELVIDEKADVALAEIDRDIETSRALLACLNT